MNIISNLKSDKIYYFKVKYNSKADNKIFRKLFKICI